MLVSPRNTPLQSDWPTGTKGYKLISAIGKGYFGIVWKGEVTEGRYKDKQVAIKKLDLEKCGNTKIEEIRKNMLLLNLLDHPNILSHKATFIDNKDLWVVSELMEGGSVDKIIQYNFANGLKDQALIATIIKETLQGLKYLHQNNQIHRDIKAANILIGTDGSVKISDFGVAAKLKEGKKRNTFIGSPCWMAPEVLDQDKKSGYDSKIDIWSLGITALELAHGKPPNCELTTMKLILKTLNDEPPRLNEEACWDESFKEFLSYCLVKDPAKRKSAEDLLKLCKPFLGKAKGKEYLKEKLFKGLGPLESRVDQHTFELAQAEINGKKLNKSHTLDFNFDDKEGDDEELSDLVDHFKVQISTKCHLPRIESELIIRRTFSSPSDGLKEPHSADYVKKENSNKQNPSKFAQKQKSEKVLLCKGDLANEFNFLPEEET